MAKFSDYAYKKIEHMKRQGIPASMNSDTGAARPDWLKSQQSEHAGDSRPKKKDEARKFRREETEELRATAGSHAANNPSDPFAYGRALLHLTHGLADPDDFIGKPSGR